MKFKKSPEVSNSILFIIRTCVGNVRLHFCASGTNINLLYCKAPVLHKTKITVVSKSYKI